MEGSLGESASGSCLAPGTKGEPRAEKFWKSLLHAVPKANHPGLRDIEDPDLACQVALMMVVGKLARKDKKDLSDKQDAAAYLSTCIVSLGDRVEDHRSIRASDSLRADYAMMAETYWSVQEVWNGDNLEVVGEDEAVAGLWVLAGQRGPA